MRTSRKRDLRFTFVAAALSVLSFLLTPPSAVLERNLVVPNAPDELNYFAHATAIVFGRFNYALETSYYFPPNHSFGPSILASPVIFLFSLADRILDHPVLIKRTYELLSSSWTGLGYPVATQIYLVIGVFILYRTLRRGLRSPHAAVISLAAVAGSGLLFFAYRRPVSSHVYEFTVVSAAIYLLFGSGLRQAPQAPGRRFWILVGAVASFIFLVRYNDVPLSVALICSALAYAFSPGRPVGWIRDRKALWIAVALLTFVALVIGVTAYFSWTGREGGGKALWNVPELQERMLTPRPVSYYLERTWHVFFGRDWALVVTAPLILLGLYGCRTLGERTYLAVPVLIALIPNVIMIICWGTNASGFGYRYFFPAALPIATVGLAAWIASGSRRRLSVCWLALIPAYLLQVFGASSQLTLTYTSNQWRQGWLNNDFLVTALSMPFRDPVRLVKLVWPRTGLSVVADWCGLYHWGSNGIDSLTSAKLIGIWLLPLALGWTLSRCFEKEVL